VPQSQSAPMPAVLVVHDDPATLYWVQRHLSEAGYRVVTDTDMFQALYRLRDDPTLRLMVADWHLGEQDAAILVHHVRKRDPGFPVVVITAYPERLERIRRRLPEDVAVLFAPLEESEMLAHVAMRWRDAPPVAREKTDPPAAD
jgi:CheY-like chemotaxis protein